MKRPAAFFGVVVILASLSGLFGCNSQEESKTATAVPPAAATNDTAATPGKKKPMEMPGP